MSLLINKKQIKKTTIFIVCWALLLTSCSTAKPPKEDLVISSHQTYQIGQQIWQNESGRKVNGLTHWNVGENFPSLGIAHFIWMPKKNSNSPYQGSFNNFLRYANKSGAALPKWLSVSSPCPWNTRKQFYDDFQSLKMRELRYFLQNTIDLQAQFMVLNLKGYLRSVKKVVSPDQYAHIEKQFYRVASTAEGKYALVDYLNFKGAGLRKSPQYHNIAWGLTQVLEKMKGENEGMPALKEFALTAKKVLWNRVQHAPNKKQELQWWPGWKNRIDTYSKFSF